MEQPSWSLKILDSLPDGIIFINDWVIGYSNPAMSDLLHLSAEEINGQTLFQLVHPEDLPDLLEMMEEISSGSAGYPSNVRLIGHNGKPISVEFIPRLVELDSGERAWICTIRDLTIESRIREAIGEVDEKYRALVESAPEAIVVYDANLGRFVDANEKAVWLFALKKSAIYRVGFAELTPSDGSDGDGVIDNLQEYIDRALEGEIVEFEWTCKGAGGKPVPCEVRLVQLPASGRNLIRCSLVDITDRKLAEDDLIQEALFDTLTGLPNRNQFYDRLEASIRRSLADAAFEFAVMFLDIDRFKNVNDSLGHMAGDQLLVEVGDRLSAVLAESDLVARIAGDEFTILLDDIRGRDYPREVAAKILAAIREPIELSGQEVRLNASIGIALSSIGYNKPENIMRDADTAMYHAKEKGKARYVFFDPRVHPRGVDLIRIENELRRALLLGEFALYFEPVVSIRDRSISGLEVFIRWNHPERGLLLPGDFIRHAEEVGLIAQIDAWVLDEACRQFQAWSKKGLSPGRIAVNLSTHHIQRRNTFDLIADALRAAEMPASSLEIELLETVLVNDIEHVVGTMNKMKALGLRLSLDDFGAVYSSLSQLRHLPIDSLRIDNTLIKDIVEDEDACAIVDSIISLAKKLGIEVIAEGVENEAQLGLLAELGCDEAQGFLFGPSRSVDQVEDLLASGLPAGG